jgi:hypothetical protein
VDLACDRATPKPRTAGVRLGLLLLELAQSSVGAFALGLFEAVALERPRKLEELQGLHGDSFVTLGLPSPGQGAHHRPV